MSYLGVFRLQGRGRDVRKDNQAPQPVTEANTAWMMTSRANGVCVCVAPRHLLPVHLMGSGPSTVPLGPGGILFPRYSFIYVYRHV